jgi:hypothetical protein
VDLPVRQDRSAAANTAARLVPAAANALAGLAADHSVGQTVHLATDRGSRSAAALDFLPARDAPAVFRAVRTEHPKLRRRDALWKVRRAGRVPRDARLAERQMGQLVESVGSKELLGAVDVPQAHALELLELLASRQAVPRKAPPVLRAWPLQALAARTVQERPAQALQAAPLLRAVLHSQVQLAQSDGPPAAQQPDSARQALRDAFSPLSRPLPWLPFPPERRVPPQPLLRPARAAACAPSRQRPPESSWSASSFPRHQTPAKGQ